MSDIFVSEDDLNNSLDMNNMPPLDLNTSNLDKSGEIDRSLIEKYQEKHTE